MCDQCNDLMNAYELSIDTTETLSGTVDDYKTLATSLADTIAYVKNYLDQDFTRDHKLVSTECRRALSRYLLTIGKPYLCENIVNVEELRRAGI